MQMLSQDRTLDFGPLGQWEFLKTAADTEDEYIEIRMVLPPQEGPPPHVHHDAEDAFRVEEGTLEVLSGEEWCEVKAGETAAIPPGTVHTFRNRAPVVVVNVHRPALEFERFFRRLHYFVAVKGAGLPPKNLRSALMMGVLFAAHERELRTTTPPQVAMRVLGGVGRLAGYRLPE